MLFRSGDAQHSATLKLNIEGAFDLQIYGAGSGLVHSSRLQGKGSGATMEIQLPILSAGNYLLRVIDDSGKVRVAKLTIR